MSTLFNISSRYADIIEKIDSFANWDPDTDADGKWYAREGYERFGENISPYKDSEIEFSYCVCQIVRS